MKSLFAVALIVLVSITTVALQGRDGFSENVTKRKAKLESPKFCDGNRYITGNKESSCELENEVNLQINREMNAFYTYMQMGYFFAHEDYNLPYLSKFFLESAQDELKHAQKLMEYQVMRGAHVNFVDVKVSKPKVTFTSALDALTKAYGLEESITKKIWEINLEAGQKYDFHLTDYLESNFITEQFESLKKLKNLMGTLKRLTGQSKDQGVVKLAEFQFDKLVMKELKS